MTGTLEIRDLGTIEYERARELQHELVGRRARDEIGDVLVLCEHEPVFTLGRGTERGSLPTDDATPVVEIERGGDVTWHGPGQLVGYWIRKLEGADRDLHAHLRWIEERLIEALAAFGVAGERRDGLTGVWTPSGKVASIGIAVKQWVTYHGFALNVDVDAAVYDRFRPCGLDGAVMTDLAALCGFTPDRDAVVEAVREAFSP